MFEFPTLWSGWNVSIYMGRLNTQNTKQPQPRSGCVALIVVNNFEQPQTLPLTFRQHGNRLTFLGFHNFTVPSTNNYCANTTGNEMVIPQFYRQQGSWRGGSSKGPEFNSRQPHGGAQASVMRSGALF